MPAPKTKAAPASAPAAAPKGKADKPKVDSAPKPTPSPPNGTAPVADASSGGGKPDKVAYDAEQEKLKKEIDELQAKLSTVREKINLAGGKNTPSDERRNQLRAELDGIRTQQGNNKSSRGKTLDQLKALNEGIAKKIKELQAAKAKTPFKSVADIDAHVRHLEKQVESGSMKISDEKRALAEISQCKRSRRTVEAFQKEQESIEADRAAADELRKQLDDPDAKAASDRFDALKAELDAIKKEQDDAYAGRSKLFDERNEIQARLDALFAQKRESAQRFRESNDKYWHKVNEDRARRAEKARTQRAAEEVEKKAAVAERIREEASAPAFQAQIEDCQTLIDHFSGKSTAPAPATGLPPRADVAGVPKLELRAVEGPTDGVVIRKKKGENEEAYFAGKGKGKAKGGKKAAPAAAEPSDDAEPAAAAADGQRLHVPYGKLAALLSMSIPPPSSSADLPRVIEDLKTKKAWFEANQKRVTAENISKAEADIARLTGHAAAPSNGHAAADVQPANGGGEKPAEPAHTPAVGDAESVPVSSGEVIDKLESVQENEGEQ